MSEIAEPSGCVVIVDVTFIFSEEMVSVLGANWHRGPVSVRNPSALDSFITKRVITTDERRKFFGPDVAPLLYGDGPRSAIRWHRTVNWPKANTSGIEISHVELVVASPTVVSKQEGQRPAVLVLHLEAPGPVGAERTAELATQLRQTAGVNALRATLSDVLGKEVKSGLTIPPDGSVFHIITEMSPILDLPSLENVPLAEDRHLLFARELASLALSQHHGGIPAERIERAREDGRVELSGDWFAMLLGAGAAFVARPERSYTHARLLVSTVYTDVLAFARLERAILREFVSTARDLLTQSTMIPLASAATLRHHFAVYTVTYGKARLASSKTFNRLLAASERQFGVIDHTSPAELDTVLELADLYAAAQREADSADTNRLLTFIAILGLPLTAAGLLLQIWTEVPAWLSAATGAAVGLVGVGVFLTLPRIVRKTIPASRGSRQHADGLGKDRQRIRVVWPSRPRHKAVGSDEDGGGRVRID